MDVTVKVAYIVIEDKEIPLSVKVAKQFPMLPHQHRFEQAERGIDAPKPILKIQHSTLDKDMSGWLYLINDPYFGLSWVAPADFAPAYVKIIIARGGWADDISTVPLAILL